MIERDPQAGTFAGQRLTYIIDARHYEMHGPFDQAGFASQTRINPSSLKWTDIEPPFWTKGRLAAFHNAPGPWPIVACVLPAMLYVGLRRRVTSHKRSLTTRGQ